MNQEKKLFRIFIRRIIPNAKAKISTLICLYATKDSIEKMVDSLNNNYMRFSKENHYWNCSYEFEKYHVLNSNEPC